jgi:hypothetical protein
MIPIEFRGKVARDVTNTRGSREDAAETIKQAVQTLRYGGASRRDQKDFWKALKADIAAARRSIPQRHDSAPANAILDAALEEILRQEAMLGESE